MELHRLSTVCSHDVDAGHSYHVITTSICPTFFFQSLSELREYSAELREYREYRMADCAANATSNPPIESSVFFNALHRTSVYANIAEVKRLTWTRNAKAVLYMAVLYVCNDG